ncbi:MAG: VanZ family protein [Bacteroidales bacterium]|nr:VanZ family protein [Bacteroidales bacterium]
MVEHIIDSKYRITWKIIFTVYFFLVIYLCFGKFDSIEEIPRTILGIPSDKFAHALMFLPFPFLFGLAFLNKYIGKIRFSLILVIAGVLAGVAFAIGTELGQMQIDYRTGDPLDFVADTTGIIIGSIITLILYHKVKTNIKAK